MLNCPTCVYADFEKDKCKRLLIRLPHVCPYAVERKPRNHFERLKAMNMEQMAVWLAELTATRCNGKPETRRIKILRWLKEEVEE